MTQGEGQARIPMTGLLLTEKPNLEGPHRGQEQETLLQKPAHMHRCRTALLVSQDHPLDTGAKENHTGDV